MAKNKNIKGDVCHKEEKDTYLMRVMISAKCEVTEPLLCRN